MIVDDYAVRIVRVAGAAPQAHIDPRGHTVTYQYDGDVAELVAAAMEVGCRLSAPILPTLNADDSEDWPRRDRP